MSEEYYSFCQNVAGYYIHHSPHYEKPHKFHAAEFERTNKIYVEIFGENPANTIWKHLGESAGCETNRTPPAPLYIESSDSHLNLSFRWGNVDCRHVNNIHTILRKKGMTLDQWNELSYEFDTAAPKSPWMTWLDDYKESPKRLFLGIGFGIAWLLVAYAIVYFVILEERGNALIGLVATIGSTSIGIAAILLA